MAVSYNVEWTFHASDIAIVTATLLGPILAVQAQKWLERRRAVSDRRLMIFRALMATRAARLAPNHVEALNAVPVEFYGSNGKLKQIVDNWRSYLDLLDNKELSAELLGVKRHEAFITMLFSMSTYLGYTFSRSQLEKDVYYPEGHKVIEDDQEVIRRGFAKLLQGQLAIPMAVKEFPTDDNAIDKQAKLTELLTEWLEGQRSVKVEN